MRQFHHKLYIVYPFLMVVMMAILIFNIFSQQTRLSNNKVSCINPSKPIVQNYFFNVDILVSGKVTKLDPNLGHDPANCLREIHTNDSTGKVFVQSVSDKSYKLADFLAILDKSRMNYHIKTITINGEVLNSSSTVLLAPNQKIEIDFE